MRKNKVLMENKDRAALSQHLKHNIASAIMT